MTEPSLFSPPHCKTSVLCSGDAEGDRDLILPAPVISASDFPPVYVHPSYLLEGVAG